MPGHLSPASGVSASHPAPPVITTSASPYANGALRFVTVPRSSMMLAVESHSL